MSLAGRLEALASNPHSSPNTLNNVTKYPFKSYVFLVVSDPVTLLSIREKLIIMPLHTHYDILFQMRV
ncbi:MAG: hypothetical protein ACK41Q_14490, partial [Candidatus Brocadia sp.]